MSPRWGISAEDQATTRFLEVTMKRIAALLLLASLAAKAFALDPFVASDIRIDGLQRISAGTVFT